MRLCVSTLLHLSYAVTDIADLYCHLPRSQSQDLGACISSKHAICIIANTPWCFPLFLQGAVCCQTALSFVLSVLGFVLLLLLALLPHAPRTAACGRIAGSQMHLVACDFIVKSLGNCKYAIADANGASVGRSRRVPAAAHSAGSAAAAQTPCAKPAFLHRP